MKTLIHLGAGLLAAGLLCLTNTGDTLASEELATVDFAIQGMLTTNCPVLVKSALGKQPGVKEVSASLETKSARVRYAPAETSPEKLAAALKSQVGFDARVVRTIRFGIQGMVTTNCPVLVKKSLQNVQGIRSVEASLESKTAVVSILEGEVTVQTIQKILKDKAGFNAVVLE